ncbi:hypothetical protein CKO25_05630 [Thiocapsa imhoffii]|uniref:FeoB-associated Cys-rich membrane protein n=1 Tax=Thiocapsa imhoffii TaxID=382777 RepID=A0A9X0WGL6_9GAMM|nr:hypothetical protein [Thiocapsa imhoffii]MBK1644140.1 hypothetical protein [Thiocapsa imhoffii]
MSNPEFAGQGASLTLQPAPTTVSAEHHFGWGDLTLTGAIVLIALYYLYHKLWKGRGRCADCGEANSCDPNLCSALRRGKGVEVRLEPGVAARDQSGGKAPD